MSVTTPIPTPILDIPVERIDGTPTSLAEHQGKVLLIVNVASQCGFTPQYSALEALYEANREKGLVVCGFPANDFAAQEPGSNAEIQSFCETSFGVKFPMYSKIVVTGDARHPLYNALVSSTPDTTGDTTDLRKHLVEFGVTPTSPPEVLWNFEKFLVGRDGRVVRRFAPDVTPADAVLREAVEAEIERRADYEPWHGDRVRYATGNELHLAEIVNVSNETHARIRVLSGPQDGQELEAPWGVIEPLGEVWYRYNPIDINTHPPELAHVEFEFADKRTFTGYYSRAMGMFTHNYLIPEETLALKKRWRYVSE